MSTAAEAKQEGNCLPGTAAEPSEAEARRRAKSLPVALRRVHGDTPGGDAASRAQAAAERVLGALDGALSGESLLRAQPPSMHAARAGHHEAAGHWNAGAAKGLRLTWAYLIHLPARAVLFTADWVLTTPARFFAAMAVLAVIWYWH